MRKLLFGLIALVLLVGCATDRATPVPVSNPANFSDPKQIALGKIENRMRLPLEDETSTDSRVRSVILRELSTVTGDTTINDLPKPELSSEDRKQLASQGVAFVIEGIASKRSSTDVNSVFLQAINTESGVVAVATAGRNKNLDIAAQEAANRLALELIDRRLLLESNTK